MYVVIVTDKNSNIIEDLESVELVKEVIYEILGGETAEEGVYSKFVDLTLACDDMVNLKMRNSIQKSQIVSLLEMNSVNEQMHNKIIENQTREAKKNMEEEYKKILRSKTVKDIVNKEVQELNQQMKEFSKKYNFKDPGDKPKKIEFKGFGDKRDSDNIQTQKVVNDLKGLSLGKKKKKKFQK